MHLHDLEKWGIAPRIVQMWQARQGPTLLPVQAKAVRRGLLGAINGDRPDVPVQMIVTAPTSSGKSFCAEMATVRQLMSRRKTVQVFPLKCLAEQKYREFRDTYGALGIKGLIVTSDHPENDHRFQQGDYQVAFVVYEKLNALLTRHLDSLANLGLIVVDELQTVGEAGRGSVLEILLTKIIVSIYTPSILGLSAVIADGSQSAQRLAAWLGAELVEESNRPIDLIRGVAAEGTLHFRHFNTGLEGTESFGDSDNHDNLQDQLLSYLGHSSGSTLVFLKSRHDTIQAAMHLASQVKWPAAESALVALKREEPSFLARSLGQALQHGVAFHNSDLSAIQREVVEQGFRDKSIKALFSTTTLCMGVNLPADTVFLETVKFCSGEYSDRPSLVPVTRSEFDNMSGRAGRLGQACDQSAGRAIVLAESEFDREILWSSYVAGEQSDSISSFLTTKLTEDWVLEFITSGLLKRSEDFETLWQHSFAAHCENASPRPDATSALERLTENDLIELSNPGPIVPTQLGRQVSESGLTVEQAIHFRKRLAGTHPQTDFGWLALALGGPGWNLPPGMMPGHFVDAEEPVRLLCARDSSACDEAMFMVGPGKFRGKLPRRVAASLKALLLLDDWCQMTALEQLEQRYQLHLGQILFLGDTVAHLLRGVAGIIDVLRPESPLCLRLHNIAFSVARGLPPKARALYDCFGKELSRFDLVALLQAGVTDLPTLLEFGVEKLRGIIVDEDKLCVINDILESFKTEVEMRSDAQSRQLAARGAAVHYGGEPELIEIEGDCERERYLVRINGIPVRLTGKSFKYLVRLAWSRLHGQTGWIYKEELEAGFNQARYLYRMKGEITAGYSTNWPIIENNRLGYYRLSIDPAKIHVNTDKLSNHPDYEVRCLFSTGPSSRSMSSAN